MDNTTKRLNGELRLIKKKPIDDIDVYQDEKNNLEWYFLLKGSEKTEYEGGSYIGKIELPSNYPNSSPNLLMLTPSGRYVVTEKDAVKDKKHYICLSNTGYHPESQSVMWTIRSFLIGLQSNMNEKPNSGHINHIDESSDDKKKKAKESYEYNVKNYPGILKNFKRFIDIDDKNNIYLV